ncbi:PAS domain-containing sensor histidine kinase [Spirosoma linguale]|uniref:histidine kinase n=1 Tax=Spirosoma linguale (strain ATCC 33905 / DSM 74 / LMG 10896 / Claus 1) TaxID=504472 RepID=D2QH92_SPILD|nr:PAS/PAC sensor signal transduction histidine kinase [Spirosoma linguale DSM 74]
MTTPTSVSSSATPLNLFASLVDHSPNGIIVYEPVRNESNVITDYRTVYYNQKAIQITGHTHEEMMTLCLFQRAPYARAQEESFRQLVEAQIPFDVEHVIPERNRWFSFENRQLDNGFFTTIRDIDDLKRAEQQLEQQNKVLEETISRTKEQQLLLKSVLDTSPNSIMLERAIRDEQGAIIDFQVVLFNQAALRLGFYSSTELAKKRISELNPNFVSSGLMAAYSNVLATGQPFQTEIFAPQLHKHLALTVTRMDRDQIIVLFDDVTQIRVDAKTLREKNELLDGVLRTSLSSIMVYEAVHDVSGQLADLRVVLTNEASLRASHRRNENIIGKLLTSLNPETRTTGLWDQYVAVYESGEIFQGKHYFPTLDKWFDATISKLGDGLVTTFNDITHVYSVNRQIEEQAQLFDGVLKNMTNGLSVLEAIRDSDGNPIDFLFVRVSEAVLRDTRLTSEQLIGKSLLSIFPGAKQMPHWDAFIDTLSTGVPKHFEWLYTLAGTNTYTDNWINRLDENRLVSVYLITNEQKQAESLAKQRASILQSVLDSCQTSIVLFEAIRNEAGQIVDFRYLVQNEANARLVNHPLAETQSRTMLEVLPYLVPSGIFERYVTAVETGQPQRFEQYYNDGSVEGWFDISVVKQDDGIVVVAHDNTLLRRTLKHAEQLVINLRQSNHNLEQFAYIASHDLQEPLRKIQSFGNLLIDQYGNLLPEDGRVMLRRMQSAAERMSQLIRDLLAYSRLSSEQEPFQPVSMQRILAEILSDLELVIQEKKARLTIPNQSAHALIYINGNRSQLRQLFQNLLSNALKFVSPDSTPEVTFQVRTVSFEEVPALVPNREKSSWIAVDITDNGIGFDEKYQEQIFHLFERLHGRNDYSGTGIGLAICRKVAENHGGTIVAKSQKGAGSTFTVFLPTVD